MTEPRLAAVLWDMDGTLVDTEPLWMAAEDILVSRYGGRWSKEQAKNLVGRALNESARILQQAGVALGEEEIIEDLSAQVIAALGEQQELPLRPGARALLESLRESGIKTALVTMSRRHLADVVVTRLGAHLFDAVIPGDEVTLPKPFPDPYLQACAALAVSPDQAVAIEDSPTGIRSATAAGVTTIGVPLIVALEGCGADVILPTLRDVTVVDLERIHSQGRGTS